MVRKSGRVKIPTSRDVGSILLRGKAKGDATSGRVSSAGEAAMARRQRQRQQRRRRRDSSASNSASSDGVCVNFLL